MFTNPMFTKRSKTKFPFFSVFILAACVLTLQSCSKSIEPLPARARLAAPVTSKWTSFVSADDLQRALTKPGVVLVDARSKKEYLAGHIPGAVNIPGNLWRTPKAEPGKGESQYLFRNSDGTPDIARYERFLSSNGLSTDQEIYVYGNFAGKADGTIPVMILKWLGHQNVKFLDGVGLEQWHKAGYEISKTPKTLEVSRFKAKPIADFVWQLKDVNANIGNDQVVFYDTRSSEEFSGAEKRSNTYGGRIPGAALLNYSDLLDADKKVLPKEVVRSILELRGITPDKKIVLYCQTATRVSLPAVAMMELGYPQVVVYDASWHEYGNRSDTKIEAKK